ncbi:MAG TPA: autotransporter assembly complex family protein, partial [Gammaproteobacteria bacterium]|nr:autotransporter assembly complex family protein [Gammaproteobacteria bacterium]
IGLSPCYAESPIEIHILGVNKTIEKNIRARISISLTKETQLTKEKVEKLHTSALKEIPLAIQPFGYYAPTIKASLGQVQNKWVANYKISLNKPTTISSLDLKLLGPGARDNTLSNIFDNVALKVGDRCAHEPYEQSKKDILSQVTHQGYIDANFAKHVINVNLDTNHCQIILHLDTKQQYHFSSVSFTGSELDNQFIQRFVPFEPKDPYTPDKILILQHNLESSDYFRKVKLDGDIEPKNLDVPITVNLEDAKPNNYLLGAGFGTDTGLRGKIGWERRRINRWGHRFETDLQLAQIYNRYQAQYIIPGRHPNTDNMKLLGRFTEDEYTEKTARIHELELSETREIYGWQRSLALTYKTEGFQEFGSTDIEHSSLLLPSISLTHVVSDDPANPTHGKKITILLLGSWDVLVSDTNFIQANLKYKWVHSAGADGTWILRSELGATLPDQTEKLPLSQRFYAGGDESIRGFQYRSLPSEIDEDGNWRPVGGAYLGIASLEYVYSLTENLGLSTFVDGGNAFKTRHDDIQVGAGFGIRWKTPIGPLRLALAKPFTDGAQSLRLHVAFGPEL